MRIERLASIVCVFGLSCAGDTEEKVSTDGGIVSVDASLESSPDARSASPDEVLVPAGTFLMGSPDQEQGHSQDERLHSVTLTRPYMMTATEITQGQWQNLMTTTPSLMPNAEHPVDSVSWYDALAYANALY